MSLQSKQNLQKKLANAKYRDTFVASWIAQTLAFQLRVLRQRTGLSQDELADKLETSQNAISRMENPNYGKSSISTLLKVAAFFKVGLIVRFAPLSEIADWTSNLSSKAVDVPDFDHDIGFIERKGPESESQEVYSEIERAASASPTSQVVPIDIRTRSATLQAGYGNRCPVPTQQGCAAAQGGM
jgi:transcriptional regulator with XRE-family HTH domain